MPKITKMIKKMGAKTCAAKRQVKLSLLQRLIFGHSARGLGTFNAEQI
jgi:hypothetical protein